MIIFLVSLLTLTLTPVELHKTFLSALKYTLVHLGSSAGDSETGLFTSSYRYESKPLVSASLVRLLHSTFDNSNGEDGDE